MPVHSISRPRLLRSLKMLGSALAVTALALLFPNTAYAQQTRAQPVSHSVIIDFATGSVLECDRCREPIPPASMSKLMTLLLVAEALDRGDITEETMVPVSERAWRHGAVSSGSHMFLALNAQVRVGDLIRGAIIVSANDACVALAERVAGSEEGFVARMNDRAAQLGLTTARFRNATGLDDPDQVISPLDLARLAAIMIREHPGMYRLYAERSFTYNNRTQENRNPLLGAFDGADGVKTGHTDASGYGLIGSAEVDGQRRIIVFNGATTMAERRDRAVRMLRSAFFDYRVQQVYAPGAVVGSAAVWLGSRPRVNLVAPPEGIAVAGRQGVLAGLTATIVYPGPIPARIEQNQPIAELLIEGPGFEAVRYPLLAAERVNRANPFARALAGVGMAFSGGN
ncbi:MAG: D-alanyl-D-alanine carboxypeptidase family protein [Caulobacterales bacterium]